jgi:hypothetical protein
MSQDLSRSMQPSPDFPPDGFQSPPGHYYPQGSRTRGYYQRGTSPQPQPPQTLRPPTYLRNLTSLATPLATPHWMQGGTFQNTLHAQERSSGTVQVPRATSWGQAQPPPVPTNTLASAGTGAAVPRADSWEQAQQPLVSTNTLGASGDAGAVLREGLTDSRHPQADPLEAEYRGSGAVEEELLLLSSSGVEEEVLECELQALRAARQQLQRASLSQVSLRPAFLSQTTCHCSSASFTASFSTAATQSYMSLLSVLAYLATLPTTYASSWTRQLLCFIDCERTAHDCAGIRATSAACCKVACTT